VPPLRLIIDGHVCCLAGVWVGLEGISKVMPLFVSPLNFGDPDKIEEFRNSHALSRPLLFRRLFSLRNSV
jgi:hypothetical protein